MPKINLEFPIVDMHTHQIPVEAMANEFIVFAESPGLVKRPQDYAGFYTFGYHPWCADKVDERIIEQEFKARKEDPQLLAFGEMGLDRVCPIDLAQQKKIFVRQLELCKQLRAPVIVVHSVRAHMDILAIVKQTKYRGVIIFHDFNGDRSDLEKLATLECECFFSLGDNLFRHNSALIRDFGHLPKQNVFLETDDSTRSIKEVYQRFADQSGQSLEEVTILIYQNFMRVFGSNIFE